MTAPLILSSLSKEQKDEEKREIAFPLLLNPTSPPSFKKKGKKREKSATSLLAFAFNHDF
jgi:hypothetical protein